MVHQGEIDWIENHRVKPRTADEASSVQPGFCLRHGTGRGEVLQHPREEHRLRNTVQHNTRVTIHKSFIKSVQAKRVQGERVVWQPCSVCSLNSEEMNACGQILSYVTQAYLTYEQVSSNIISTNLPFIELIFKLVIIRSK